MTIKNLSEVINQSIDYNNFSNEVTVISEARQNTGYSLYTVTRNDVTFQNVPGSSGISDAGGAFMGYVNNDRGRPILLSAGTKTNNTKSDTTTGLPNIDITGEQWDIQLIVTDSCGGTSTSTQFSYISVT